MSNLIWQLPVAALVFLLLGRLIWLPINAYRRYRDAHRELTGQGPLTLKKVARELVSFEDSVGEMVKDIFENGIEKLERRVATLESLILEKHGDGTDTKSDTDT